MSEEIVEVYNPWVRAITSTEASTIIIIVYWLVLAFLRYSEKIPVDMFYNMFLSSGFIGALLKLLNKGD